ncbi:MAG: hypothetical protein Q605_AUC00935G0002, partial [Actinomyces urogenitalis DORA_12]
MKLRALVTGDVLAGEVAVSGADGEGRRDGDVGGTEGSQAPAHQLLADLRRGDSLVHVQVQHGAAGVLGLQLLLHLLSLEGVVGVADRKLGGVGVVGVGLGASLEDLRETTAVLLGEAVGRALGGGGLQVVEVTGGLLEGDHHLAHVIEDAHAHGVAARVGDVVGVSGEVADHLVHAVDADGGEVVVQRAQPALGEGEQTSVDVVLDDGALELQGVTGDAEQPVKGSNEAGLVTGVGVTQARHVDRDHTDAAGLLGRAEQAVAALEQLAQVEL